MKKIILTILFLCILSPIFADESTLARHYKIFPKNPDELFLEALSALNQSKFEISEIQSQNGYILFSSGSKFYLLTVTKKYQNQTEVKILPQNSDFSISEEIAKQVFALIEAKIKTNPLKMVK